MAHLRSRPIYFVSAIVLSAALGCQEEPPSFSETLATCAELPALKTATLAGLHEALAKVEEENGTPLQLIQNLPADEENIAAALASVFDPLITDSLLRSSQECYPNGLFEFNQAEYARAISFKNSHAKQLRAVQDALQRPKCNFGIEYDKGFFYEAKFIPEVTIAARLLAFDIAEKLDAKGPSETIPAVRNLFRLIECLANEKFVASRVEANWRRRDALLVLLGVAKHPSATQDDLANLYSILQIHLSNWPSDAQMLIGERAVVMHAYEGIRLGLLPSFLTREEKMAYSDKKLWEGLEKSIIENIESDELQYLTAMRKLIDTCDQPYYKRSGIIYEVLQEISDRRSTKEYAFAADQIFLPDIEKALQFLAEDRARCEATALALAAAAGIDAPRYQINPRTGNPYEVHVETYRVQVGNEDELWAPIVPIPGAKPSVK